MLLDRQNPLCDTGVMEYLGAISRPIHPVAMALREHTLAQSDLPNMLSSPEQVNFLVFLQQLIKAKDVIEVGVFTGYTSLCLAAALPDKGRIIACDKSSVWTATAQDFWRQARVDHKINLQIDRAETTLQCLLEERGPACIDMIYIDADKINYPRYYELGLKLLRSGGLMVFDDVLWCVEPVVKQTRPTTRALHRFNLLLQGDPRVNVSWIPLGTGMLLVAPTSDGVTE